MTNGPEKTWDVAVVGAGMGGMAAALFAAERGLSCIQIGNAGGILFSSGLLDLLAVHPVVDSRVWRDPFAALDSLRRDRPEHPLGRAGDQAIRAGFDSVLSALRSAGLPYANPGDRNRAVPTSIGSTKTTFAVPESMLAGAQALGDRLPCLIVDFRGLREFSACQIVSTMGAAWHGLRCATIEFPGNEAVPELYAAHLAQALEREDTRLETIARLKPLVGDARAIGLPTILGMARSQATHRAFEEALGIPVFEIPTMPTSVPGLRLKEALETALSTRGVHRVMQARVKSLVLQDDANLVLEGDSMDREIRARAVVLATGRFIGRGLRADRGRIVETLLDLPVHQPASRAQWHRRDFLDPAGHEVNRSGVMVDNTFRPLDVHGNPVWSRLFAVGTMLAHQDWMREKCGSGLAIGTAWTALERADREIGASRSKAG
jgi:glycerol-3-phosphate dehydrogenase subunit B